MNRFQLSGVLIERSVLRWTPAGVAVLEARMAHESEVMEAERPRRIILEAGIKALGAQARQLNEVALGSVITVSGFMAARSNKSPALVLHVTDIEFKEGI